MRARFTTTVAAVAIIMAPLFASADSVEDQLRLMNERMGQMEDQLQATQDQLDDANARVEQQQDVMEKAGLERQAQSGLSAFLSETQFSGYIATSWNWQFNHPEPSAYAIEGGRNGWGALGITAPFHAQPNNFQLDEFYLQMEKPATPESRAGWNFGVMWGETAAVSSTGEDPLDEDGFSVYDTMSVPYVHRAYVEYLADVGSGVNVRLGRFGSPVGVESQLTADNFNITRGLLWSLQPVNHTGLEVSGACDCGIDWSLAVANDYWDDALDSDQDKTFVGHVGYTAEMWGVAINGVWGGNLTSTAYGAYDDTRGPGSDRDAVGLLDVVVTADPTEALSLWLNFDYYWSDGSGSSDGASSLTPWGIAAAGRYAITEKTGIALRAEWLELNDARAYYYLDEAVFGDGGDGADSSIWSITGTLDHALTDNLTVRAEMRYDRASGQGSPDNFFIDDHSELSSADRFNQEDQLQGLIQLLYRF
jgi:hypothetical protein